MYAWMKGRDSAAYRETLEPLRAIFTPQRIYVDFESKLHSAAVSVFPEATIKGCFVSYCIVSEPFLYSTHIESQLIRIRTSKIFV